MRFKIFVLATIFFIADSHQEDFKINGSYRVISSMKTLDGDIEIPEYTIEFRDSDFRKTFETGGLITGSIKRVKIKNKPQILYLKDHLVVNQETQLDSLLIKSFGSSVMEFEEIDKDTISFRTTREFQLSVTLNEGILVKE